MNFEYHLSEFNLVLSLYNFMFNNSYVSPVYRWGKGEYVYMHIILDMWTHAIYYVYGDIEIYNDV